jgi:hypothetical protein
MKIFISTRVGVCNHKQHKERCLFSAIIGFRACHLESLCTQRVYIRKHRLLFTCRVSLKVWVSCLRATTCQGLDIQATDRSESRKMCPFGSVEFIHKFTPPNVLMCLSIFHVIFCTFCLRHTECLQWNALILSYRVSTMKLPDFGDVLIIYKWGFHLLRVLCTLQEVKFPPKVLDYLMGHRWGAPLIS